MLSPTVNESDADSIRPFTILFKMSWIDRLITSVPALPSAKAPLPNLTLSMFPYNVTSTRIRKKSESFSYTSTRSLAPRRERAVFLTKASITPDL